jgi:peptidyl-prolyl cis-trans isomerase C
MFYVVRFCGFAALLAAAGAAAEPLTRADLSTPFITTPGFELSEFDLYMYMSPEEKADGDGYQWRSPAMVKEGADQLYALSILREEADLRADELLSEDQRVWIAEYALSMALVKKYLAVRVEEELSDVDWEALAYERFLSDPTAYASSEQISVRTLLLKTDCRAESAALELGEELLERAQNTDNFEALVAQYTEDPVAAEKGGLMPSVRRGQTVPEFEKAAFAINTIGSFAPLTVTQYGVHLIQLLDKKPAVVPSYDEVKAEIMREVRLDVAAKTLASLRRDARAKSPDGLVIHQAEIDAFMEKIEE